MNPPSPSFARLMADATRLARTGNVHGASAAIRAALGGAVVPTAAGNVRADPGVIDVLAREVSIDAPPPVQHVPAAGQFIGASHTDVAGTRTYKLYVPPGYRGQALPLVVMLHGCTQSPDDFAIGTRMNEAALERNFLVLYPAQAHNANPSRCWSWFKHNHQGRGRGEPALLAGMTRAVMARYAVDPQRVYAAGLSAGGAMAVILGDAYPDLFAAIGVHSGLPTGSATDARSAFAAMKGGVCSVSAVAPAGGTPPTIVFHGEQDTTVHPINGERIVAASAAGATPEFERERSANGRAYTRRIYRAAGGRVVAEHWTVHGAGHAWSGGNPRGSYTDAQGPDATDAMLRFFFSNSMHCAHAGTPAARSSPA
jgi:poly(hydroxyalkanoate) depolymerase family esterase